MRRVAIALGAVSFLVILAIAAIAIWVPGQQADRDYIPSVPRPAFASNGPNLCIDEAHHNAHTATGTYQPFAQLLKADGYRIERSGKRFEQGSLARCRVLVVANAAGAPRYHIYGLNLPIPVEGKREDPAFTSAEVADLLNWVRNGGSLLLVADHFPYGSASAGLAEAFGVNMSAGFSTAPNRDPAGNDPGQLIFTRSNGLLGDHPILEGRSADERIDRIITFTGQSLAARGASTLLALPDGAIDNVPPPPSFKAVSAKGRNQGLAMQFGKGRIVVLGEAAFLTAQRDEESHFGLSRTNQNAQFALNIVHWLTGLS